MNGGDGAHVLIEVVVPELLMLFECNARKGRSGNAGSGGMYRSLF
jgi:hypothetical protein